MLAQYLEFIVPGQSSTLVEELRTFLKHREVVGAALLLTMLFLSALVFSVLENAMSVIFFHRVAIRRRHFLVSAVMPYLFILFLSIGLLFVTLVSGALQVIGTCNITILGQPYSLDQRGARRCHRRGDAAHGDLSRDADRAIVRARYLVGRQSSLLWEITRHVLEWYFKTMSQMQVVHSSLATSVAVLGRGVWSPGPASGAQVI